MSTIGGGTGGARYDAPLDGSDTQSLRGAADSPSADAGATCSPAPDPATSGDALRARTINATPPAAHAGGTGRTALQRHADYFDLNGDGMISNRETRKAIKALGMSGTTAGPVGLTINLGLGKKTGGRRTKINIDNIHQGKHAGDTGIFDKGGNFVPEKFEEMWQSFDLNQDGELTQHELDNMINTNVAEAGGEGKLAARGEFYLLMDIAGKVNQSGEKTLTRDQMQSFYDGSLFPDLAAERAKDPHKPKIARGIAGLARTLGGILGGRRSGPTTGRRLTTGDEPTSVMAAQLSGARLAACPALQ
ncbi:MAG: caleosin family protein [Planctomycetota bacterium]